MTIPQQKFREIVFQILYSHDMNEPDKEELIALLMKELSVNKKIVREAWDRVQHILEKKVELDNLIRKVSLSYSFERIQRVEKNVLRLAIYEMLFDDDIPPKVAIAEAMRLSKKFSNPESVLFINALLDHVFKLSLGEPINTSQLSKTLKDYAKKEDPKIILKPSVDPEENLE